VALKQSPAYRAVADAFAAEGADTVFCLLGDGNMHWATAMSADHGARLFHMRHEHCAVAAASSHARATGGVGIASVTCGPGFTQTMTALTTAARARIPLVLMAGEAPLNAAWHNQGIDQRPFAMACGAEYVAAHSLPRLMDHVRTAFYVARAEHKPVVLGIPYDLQKQPASRAGYVPSTALLPARTPIIPDAATVARAADSLASAKRPVVLAGRGVLRAGAVEEVRRLADVSSALLATTLPVRGLYDDHPFSIGIAGGFSSPVAYEALAGCDVLVAVGASVSNHTADGGKLFGEALVIHVDEHPHGLNQGLKTGDIHLRADARLAAAALAEAIEARGGTASTVRTREFARRIAEDGPEPAPAPVAPGLLHPTAAIGELDRVIPKEWRIVSGSGHSSYFTALMRGRPAERFHTIREFGAIGNGLAYAIGVAAAHPEDQIVLVEGDGGLLMHAQELETVRRHGLRILVCVLNDGGYGSELHKLRADGLDDGEVFFGRGNLGAVARGFGLEGAVVSEAEQLSELVERYMSHSRAGLLDIHISDEVASPPMMRVHGAPRRPVPA
jgi:acetolactate synthase I/II/III large subunit